MGVKDEINPGTRTADELRARELALEERKLAMQEEQLAMQRQQMEFQARQLAVQETQAAAMAMQVERTAPKENPNYQASGIFVKPGTGEGRPWTEDLKCAIFDGPIHLNALQTLSGEEVAALNRIEPIEHATIRKVDNSLVKATVVGGYDASGKLTKLVIVRPMGRDDNAQHFPPLIDMANQLADQAALATV
jgi:hypothetical protein